MSVSDMALDLNIKEKEIQRYCLRHKLIINQKTDNNLNIKNNIDNFNFSRFIYENLWVFIVLMFLIFISYFNSLDNAFVSDDIAGILRNPMVGKFSNIFNTPLKFSPQTFFHFIAYHIGGLDTAYFRIFNIIIHMTSTFILFIILCLIANKKIAVFTSVIFAVHPILTESVTWLSGMPYSLSSLFILLSIILYILKKNKIMYFLSIISYALALLTSEKTIAFILIIILFEILTGDIKKKWKFLSTYASLGTLYTMILIGRIGQRTESLKTEHYQEGGVDNPLIQVPISIVNYLKLIFWPKSLTLYHTDLMVTWTGYLIILAIFIVFLGIIVYGYKKNRQMFFWLSFFLISLFHVLTPLRISWVVAERYVYLGSIGIFVVISMGFAKLSEYEKWKPYVYSVFAIIVIALSVRTILRNNDWQNEDTLWIATAKVSDAGPVIHNNLGDMYARHGDLEKAVTEFKRSTEINPRYADGYHNLALTYIQMQKYDLAIENFQKALSINPNIWQSHQQLAAIYFYQEKFDKALEEVNIALTIDPNNPELKQNFEIISQKAGGN